MVHFQSSFQKKQNVPSFYGHFNSKKRLGVHQN